MLAETLCLLPIIDCQANFFHYANLAKFEEGITEKNKDSQVPTISSAENTVQKTSTESSRQILRTSFSHKFPEVTKGSYNANC